MAEVICDRALNRALLDRQLLLSRVRLPALATVEHLVGLQAQEPLDPYVGLWARLDGFDPVGFGAALADRAVVRIALQRSTIHLVTARDCLALRPVLQPVGERMARGQFGRRLDGVDLAELAAAARELVDTQPLTFGELGTRLVERWPGRDPMALAQTARALLPLVQIPPRAVWQRSGRSLHVTAESWLGRPLGTEAAPDDLVLRYLAAFGPASVADAQNWSGLTRLGEVVDRLVPRLRTFGAEDGRVLYDLPDAPRPGPDVPAPVRFLPQYDNVLLGHADRGRIVPPAAAELADEQYHWSPLLVDGLVRGVWRVARERGRVTLHARVPGLAAAQREAVVAEATALLAFLEPAAAAREVRVGPSWSARPPGAHRRVASRARGRRG
ncbi:MAG: winged helix DNA-binding domain-containing protein [Mycobacteriales bacterium]